MGLPRLNEGYTATSGAQLLRAELTAEAIRLARKLPWLTPATARWPGSRDFCCGPDARRQARTAPDGSLVPLSEQDRTLWNTKAIAEGVALVTDTLSRGPIGPYQLQAAIAAVHDEAPTAEVIDWPQMLALYTVLERVAPNPTVTLNRAMAVAKVQGPAAGWPSSTPSRPTRASRPPTTSCSCEPTCWRWPATTTRRTSATKRRPDAQPANPRRATS
jgi:predicted RNA polymerase sigma factor